MRKNLIFKYLIFIFLLSFNQLIAEECDFDFEIGDNSSKAISIYGEPEELTHEFQYFFIKQDFSYVCPGYGMEDAEIKILIRNNEIGGFLIESFTRKDDEDNEDKLIYYYIKKSFGNLNLTKLRDLKDPSWTGGVYWEANGIKYYYSKSLNEYTLTVSEELFITTKEYRKYFR